VGARSVLIEREDFLTPPEFAGLNLAQNPTDRIGGAKLELARVGDETRLGFCYQQIPVRLMPPFVFDSEVASLLFLINLTAGLLDGDGHLIELKALRGANAVVTGQSATRVHPALGSFSTQQWVVDVEEDACLVMLPGPAIPYQGCRYYQRGRVSLAPRARLIWGDIWLAGRYERGAQSERFRFERIVQDFEARRDGELVYRDRFCWNGPWSPEVAGWHFGGNLAAGSLFVAGPMPGALPDPPSDVRRSIFRLDTGESCIRWCGSPAAVTTDLVYVALKLAAEWSAGPGAPPWLLESNNLTPNHWFSTAAR
jgi:urease accessory protein